MNFDFFVPTRIVFGAGRLAEIGAQAKTLGERAVLVAGGAARRHSIVDRVTASLGEARLSVVATAPIGPNPKASDVDGVVSTVRQTRADLIIAVGGGSVLDAAKAAGACMPHGAAGPLVGRTLDPSPGAVPVIAVPTTAGTGAEVTRGAIITDERRGLKSGIRGDDVQPRVAICDPDLIATMPPSVLADTVFDTVTHLVETIVARRATALSRTLSKAGIDLLLPEFGRPIELADPAVRERLQLAALLGGVNIATVSSCLPHRIQQAMGSVDAVNCSHGRGLALVYLSWLAHVRSEAPQSYAAMSAALGGDAETTIRGVIERLGLPDRLRGAGYRAEHLTVIGANVTGNVDNDPIPDASPGTVRSVLEMAL